MHHHFSAITIVVFVSELSTPFVHARWMLKRIGDHPTAYTANRVLMLEHSIYSVISPEGCASILWRSAEQNQEAAEALRLTAQDLEKLGVIDQIVPEPLGAAHRGRTKTIAAVGDAIEESLHALRRLDGGTLKVQRRDKFLAMGQKGLG